MSTIRRRKGTLKNVTYMTVWGPGCEDVTHFDYTRRAVESNCTDCNVCKPPLKPRKYKVVVENEK